MARYHVAWPCWTRLLLVPRQIVLPSQYLATQITCSLGLLVTLLVGVCGMRYPSVLVEVLVCGEPVALSSSWTGPKSTGYMLRVVCVVFPVDGYFSFQALTRR